MRSIFLIISLFVCAITYSERGHSSDLLEASASVEMDCNELHDEHPAHDELELELYKEAKEECRQQGMGLWKFKHESSSNSCQDSLLAGEAQFSCIF